MILDKLRQLFSGTGEVKDSDAIFIYVKCAQCGAPVKIRADKRHDLRQDYETGGYVLRKEVMDGTCFNLFHFTLRFDTRYRIVDREIEGGEFLTWEEYRALTQPSAKS